jgi:hypothetical protein
MLNIHKLRNNKSLILDETISWQKINHPTRTNDYDKCVRDLNFVFDAYVDDLTINSTRNIKFIASKYWFNDERQIQDYEIEIAVHNYMIERMLFDRGSQVVNDYWGTTPETALISKLQSRHITADELINLKSILIETIKSGPEYMNYSHMHKYQYVMEYDTENFPDPFLIKQSLYEAWSSTPSKQQFMPYNIFVLGPDDKKIKEMIYYKALVKEYETNFPKWNVDVSDHLAVEKAFLSHRLPPQYLNYKTAPYILICTQRVEDQINPFNKLQVSRGFNFEQTTSEWQKDPKRKNRAQGLAMIEIGMFAQSFSNLCLKHNIDVSHTRCLPTTMDFWTEPEFNFLENPPQLILSAGFGKIYRRDYYPDLTHSIDYRPDFERIVKFINEIK